DRVVLLRCDDAQEVALANDLNVRKVANRAFVDGDDWRDEAPHGLAARANDPPVQHPGHPDVLDVDLASGHDRRNIDPLDTTRADQLVLTYGLRRRRTREDALPRPRGRWAVEISARPAGGVHIPARRHRDVEQLAAEKCSVGDGL